MHLLNRPTNGVIVAKNSDLKMLCTLLLSLSTNCKNAMLKLTQNTSRKVIATNGSECAKLDIITLSSRCGAGEATRDGG